MNDIIRLFGIDTFCIDGIVLMSGLEFFPLIEEGLPDMFQLKILEISEIEVDDINVKIWFTTIKECIWIIGINGMDIFGKSIDIIIKYIMRIIFHYGQLLRSR